uniref:Putative secreted protein n=1 Tax=Amblyomma cajennense TaxID=34607 RepID=A0A023FBI0_AMBCJ
MFVCCSWFSCLTSLLDTATDAPACNFHNVRCACLMIIGVYTYGNDECWLEVTGPFFVWSAQLLLPRL